jgi:mTERF domain-containing protein
MKKEDVDKLVYRDTWIFTSSERRLKSAFSLLQELGIEGEALSDLVARVPRLLLTSEERIVESFKQAECFGFKKGSIMFAIAVRAIFQTGKENLDRKLQCLSSLGFSEKQISDLIRRNPVVVCLSEEKLKCNVDFIVKTVGLPLADIEKYPCLLDCSLETRMIPRYRVLEALKSMQVHLSKRGICFPKIIQLTEKRFLGKYVKYVNLNAESSPVLQDIYYGEKAGKLIIDKETCSERITFFSSQRSFLWPENPSQGVLR